MAHVILFEHIDFRGAHKHVFKAEPNLAAGDDTFFNDLTSSIVILEGTWSFYTDANFIGELAVLGPGMYRWVEEVGIPNDSISSLQPSILPTNL